MPDPATPPQEIPFSDEVAAAEPGYQSAHTSFPAYRFGQTSFYEKQDPYSQTERMPSSQS